MLIKIYSILGIMFLSFSINAQEVWTLRKCIEHALENNIDILQSRLAEENAELDMKLAKHAQYPNLNGSSSFNMNFGRTIDPVTNAFQNTNFTSNNVSLSSGVILYNYGRLRNAIKQSNINRESASYDTESAERDVALLIAQNYINALFAQENVRISESQLAVVNEQLTQLERLIEAGASPAADALDIEAQIASSEQSLITNKNNLTIALLRLKQSIRLPINTEMILEEPSGVSLLNDPDVVTYEEIIEVALENEPSVKAAQLSKESAKIGVDIAKSSLYPRLSFGGSLGTNYSNQSRRIIGYTESVAEQDVIFNGNAVTIGFPQANPILEDNPYFNQFEENLSYGFGLQLSVPIYENYNSRGSVQRSKINMETVELNEYRILDQLKITIQQALADARAAKRTYAAAEKTMITRKAAYENAQKKYSIGNITSFELMSNQNNYEQSQVNALIAKYDYFFATKVLDFYMGKPLFLNN